MSRLFPYIKTDSNTFACFDYFFNVRCFSACSTVFSSTYSPFLRLTLFMYFRAWFSESAFSPKWAYSSSVVGTQNGSISTTYHKKGQKRPKYHVITFISPSLAQFTISSYRKQTHGLQGRSSFFRMDSSCTGKSRPTPSVDFFWRGPFIFRISYALKPACKNQIGSCILVLNFYNGEVVVDYRQKINLSLILEYTVSVHNCIMYFLVI